MLKILSVAVLLSFISCSSPGVLSSSSESLIPQKQAFMSKAQIFAELKQTSAMRYMDSQLTEADKLRMGKLISPDVFFAKDSINIKSKKSTNIQFKGSAEVDLRDRDTNIKSQDDGKCTAFAGVAALENTINRDKPTPGLDLSEWDAWSHYGEYSCESFIKAASSSPLCDEKLFPQYGKDSAECKNKAYAKLTSFADLGSDLKKVVAALDRGNVVYTGMSTPMDIVKCKKVVSKNTTVSDGGHAMVITGYYMQDGEVVFILRNSWGKDCSDNGYVYMPASICEKSNMYCMFWEIKKVSTDRMPVEPVCKKWKRVWYAPWKMTCSEWV